MTLDQFALNLDVAPPRRRRRGCRAGVMQGRDLSRLF